MKPLNILLLQIGLVFLIIGCINSYHSERIVGFVYSFVGSIITFYVFRNNEKTHKDIS